MTKNAIIDALRALSFNTPADELQEATALPQERAALEAAGNFLAGYLRGLARYGSGADWDAEAHRIEKLERGIVARLAALSARFHEETRERLTTLAHENEPGRNATGELL